jgi:hypothetical protein
MKDPKFGYHWIWMLPIAWVHICYTYVFDFGKNVYHQIRLKAIHKRNPDIKELSKLAGIKK